MITLHGLRDPLPYPDVALLTADRFEEIADEELNTDGEIYGRLYDMWWEDDRATALWGFNDPDNPDRWIINIADTYTPQSNMTYLREDVDYIRRNGGAGWYLYSHNALTERGVVVRHIETDQQALF